MYGAHSHGSMGGHGLGPDAIDCAATYSIRSPLPTLMLSLPPPLVSLSISPFPPQQSLRNLRFARSFLIPDPLTLLTLKSW